MSLEALMYLPIQHIIDYHDLVAKIKEATWEGHPDELMMSVAVEEIEKVYKKAIEKIKLCDNKIKLFKLQKTLLGKKYEVSSCRASKINSFFSISSSPVGHVNIERYIRYSFFLTAFW